MNGSVKKAMTKRLFDEDATLRECSAVVTVCEKKDDGYLIRLDRTVFYPEGGGQPGDIGVFFVSQGDELSGLSIDSVGDETSLHISDTDKALCHVLDTREIGGDIAHLTDAPLPVGTRVRAVIDWERRFSLMQNHSGEHIVSGLIHEAFGYENVGFHMGSDFLTIDLNGELTMEDLAVIQLRANEIVWRDVPIEIELFESSEAVPYDYRSKKALLGQVRIVTIPGADVCACCGTHVPTTGQIGLIKLISCVRFKGGVRIEMLCGRRALAYLEATWQENHRISNLLSAKPLETSKAVARVMENAQKAEFELIRLENEARERFAKELMGKGNVVILSGPMRDPQGVRQLANAVMEVCGGICCVFAGSDETDYKYAIGEKDGDVRPLVKAVNDSLGGRGGGKPFFAQGSVGATGEKIASFFTNVADRDLAGIQDTGTVLLSRNHHRLSIIRI